jgi:hypothetical protein
MKDILWEEVLHPGMTWSHNLKRGTAIRLIDEEGGANVAAALYNADNPVERYNMADTLKAQHIAKLTRGNVLYSDMGRILCSITEDTVGWHDPIGGLSNAALVARKYGQMSYQQAHNNCFKNAYDGFVVELGKYGLGRKDLIATVNFFSRVSVTDTGLMRLVTENSKADDFVELRAEMNVLLFLNTCQHPMDPNPEYQPRKLRVQIGRVPAVAADDICRTSRLENERGFILTERYFL